MYTIYSRDDSSLAVYTSLLEDTVLCAVVHAAANGHSLHRADLTGADLARANLSNSNFSGADLTGADLTGADLSRANLSNSNLSGADLSRANLSGANLYGANLFGANLSDAKLSGAYLSGANLSGANLSGVNLYGTNLSGAKLRFLLLSPWNVIITPTHTHIGCQRHINEQWLSWTPDNNGIRNMHTGASAYWNDNQAEIKRNILEVMGMVNKKTKPVKE